MGSTQPLTEMSTRNLPEVKVGRLVRLTTLPPFVSRLFRENVGASTSDNAMDLHGLLHVCCDSNCCTSERVAAECSCVIIIPVIRVLGIIGCSRQCQYPRHFRVHSTLVWRRSHRQRKQRLRDLNRLKSAKCSGNVCRGRT
jgi:hypothetical protein